MQKIEKKWYQYGQPGSQVNLNSEIVSSELIDLPTPPEQQKIAIFLKGIDNKTDLINQQLEKTKKFKKGLLQQMFV